MVDPIVQHELDSCIREDTQQGGQMTLEETLDPVGSVDVAHRQVEPLERA